MIFDSTIRNIEMLTVHAGVFHSDDVFCAALAEVINPEVKIQRVLDAAGIETDVEKGLVVADIGRGPFDHHQSDCPYREDGIRHCGASRMWLVYGVSAVRSVCGNLPEEDLIFICEKMDNRVLQTIAALDNGTDGYPKNVYSIAAMVETFRPAWDEEQDYDAGFLKAVEWMKEILINEIRKVAAERRGQAYVRECIGRMEHGMVMMETFCPWKSVVVPEKDILTIIYPSKRGGWSLEPVPVKEEELKYRVNIPEQWRGTEGAQAAALREGMTFCHASGFLAVFDTREHAREAAVWLGENCRTDVNQ